MKRSFNLAALLAAVVFAAAAQAQPVPSAAAKSQLAPTGKLRIGLTIPNPNNVNQPAGEKLAGIGIDIGEALAKQLGVPLEVVRYMETKAVIEGATTSKWDVAILGIEPSRKSIVDFSSPYAVTKNTYLVPTGSALKTIQDVDKKGVKVTVSDRTAQHVYLKDALKNASLVPAKSNVESSERLVAGSADAMAANLNTVEAFAAKMPGYRVLPGSFSEVQYSIAVPKGREAGAAYVDEFMKHMRSSGAIQKSIDKAQMKGVTVP